jgi:RimJ/RimL family protein N-acetyltransferase
MSVTLREVASNDLALFFEFQRDPDAVRMAAFTHAEPSDRAAFDAHWARVLANPTVVSRTIEHDGAVVGNAGSYLSDGEREVTYWVERANWGRGIASATLGLLIAEIDQRPLHGRCADDNVGSRKVLEKHGFVLVGSDIDYAEGRGENVRELVFRLD